jgi:hypothetical protein
MQLENFSEKRANKRKAVEPMARKIAGCTSTKAKIRYNIQSTQILTARLFIENPPPRPNFHTYLQKILAFPAG